MNYENTILAMGGMAVLMLIQLIVADVVGVKVKHPPGSAVPSDHNSGLFRATRTMANTNESIAIFILAVLFCIYSNASPVHTAYAAWGFVTARVGYAVCYYGNVKLLRSVLFGISLLFLLALLVIGIIVWL
ncbi:MAG: MAPEG family protein [Pseudomonadales bacterium]